MAHVCLCNVMKHPSINLVRLNPLSSGHSVFRVMKHIEYFSCSTHNNGFKQHSNTRRGVIYKDVKCSMKIAYSLNGFCKSF